MKSTKLATSLILLLTALLGITYADFKIPITDSGNFNQNQARIYTTDFDALVQGVKGEGVVSGCAVTAQGTPDMTVAVAAGTVKIAGALATVASGNATITAAHATLPRWDIVVSNSSGTTSVTAGTAASSPLLPAIPASSVILAAVYVPAADTAIAGGQITDKRVIVERMTVVGTASFNLNTGAVTSLNTSGVVTGITRTSTGNFTITLSNPPSNYIVSCNAGMTGVAPVFCVFETTLPLSSTAPQLAIFDHNGTARDAKVVTLSVIAP